MKRLFVLVALFIISCYLNRSIGAGLESLFPEVKGWKLSVSERVFGPTDLWDMIDGAADTYLSYSFLDLHLADYENDAGIDIRVELYRHNTFDNAFGIYTAERSPDYHFIDIGSQGYIEEGALNFLCGYYYVKINSGNKGAEVQSSLIEIARSIDKELVQEKNWPGILQSFPSGAIAYSERYIAENFLGFEFLHSAFTADYKKGGEEFQIFIIRTKNPEEVHEMLTKYLDFTKQTCEISDGLYKIQDPYNGDIDVILKGNTMAGIINCNKESIRTEFLNLLMERL
jgi:hypothetical protein